MGAAHLYGCESTAVTREARTSSSISMHVRENDLSFTFRLCMLKLCALPLTLLISYDLETGLELYNWSLSELDVPNKVGDFRVLACGRGLRVGARVV